MSATPLAKARLLPQGGEAIVVQFNPESLLLELTNSLESQSRDATRRQLVSASSGKLTLTLQFDTSVSGQSVRELTLPVKRLLRPDEADSATQMQVVPPLTRFEWGSFAFSGIAESYRETLDFWSAEGVPLRASVALVLAQQVQPPQSPPAARRPAPPPMTLGICRPEGLDGAAGLAARQPQPGMSQSDWARAIAGSNGEDSLRHTRQRSLALPAAPRGTPPSVGGGEPAQVGQGRSLGDLLRFGA